MASVNFNTIMGHDSENRLICANRRVPNTDRIIIVRTIMIVMATTLLIFSRTKRFTTGWSTMAIITENIRGTIMASAMYKKASKANRLMRTVAVLM